MNNKGFMMAEVVVVASIVLVTMAGLYASYNKIFSLYNQRINYYDVATLYELGTFKEKYLPEKIGIVNISSEMFGDDGVGEIDGTLYKRTIYYVTKDQLSKYGNDNSQINTEGLNITFKDYIKYISNSIMFDNQEYDEVNNFLIMEKCELNNVDICKYAYLEVYNIEVEAQ